jgi:protein associated with RNAse G/E
MEQTAVEYIVEQLDCLYKDRKLKLIDAETFFKHKKAIVEYAKAIEKGQKGYGEDDLQECMLQMAEYLMDCLENNTRPNSEQKAKEIIDLFKQQEQ